MRVTYSSNVPADAAIKELIGSASIPLTDDSINTLIEKIGDARYVLLGEASHGTHEYYIWRSLISKKLIEEKGFSFIAVEGDWPDCYKVNRYVKAYPDAAATAPDVLGEFNRWPSWMWANWEMVAFISWLRESNDAAKNNKAGFYGLDVYSLWESLEMIIGYLDKKDPSAKEKAMLALQCFEPYADKEGQSYAKASLMVPELCEKEVVDLLMQVRQNMPQYNTDRESVMSAEQNAFVIVNAESYYRAMIHPGSGSWNIRDHHMAATLQRLMDFHGSQARAIVWAHNTHIGDSRATDMVQEGMVNIGEILNRQHEGSVYSIGFGSNKGTVIAADRWGGTMKELNVPAAPEGTWEYILHELSGSRIIEMNDRMKKEMGHFSVGHRAIGVVYKPAYEAYGNYVPSVMPLRYDAFIYIDETKALHPLHIKTDNSQMPESFPFGT